MPKEPDINNYPGRYKDYVKATKNYDKELDLYFERLINAMPIVEDKSINSHQYFLNIVKEGSGLGANHEYKAYFDSVIKNNKESILVSTFSELLTKFIEKRYYGCVVRVYVNDNHSLNKKYCLERTMVNAPLYLSELKVEVSASHVSYDRIDSIYNRAYEDYENSEISKWVTWQEYSDSTKSKIGSELAYVEREINLDNSFRKQDAKKKVNEMIFRDIRAFYNRFNVFYNNIIYVNGKEKSVALLYKKLSTTIKWLD